MLDRLKQRWGVESTRRIAVIFLVFALTGTSILYVKGFVLRTLHIPEDITLWIRIPLIILVYQVMLLFFGALLGEGAFFWEKEKRMFRFLSGRR
jgi:hypothetical protein